MLASLIALSAFARVQNPQFPKPNVDTPPALLEPSIFKYLTEEDKAVDWKPLVAGRDWSNLEVPATKPDAVKIKILLTVAERDFSDPHYSNILESRDKTRLLEAAARLKTLYTVISNGTINVEIIPRFYPDPIYDIHEFKDLIDTEFNKSKFEADDSIERGPFAAILAISSSHVSLPPNPNDDYSIKGFADLGGSGQDMWLEEGLFYLAQSSIRARLASHLSMFDKSGFGVNEATKLVDILASLQNGEQKLVDPTFRQDGDLLTKWATEGGSSPTATPSYVHTVVQSPGSVEAKDGVLTYSELSLMRAGGVALPATAKFRTAKSLKFDIKTASTNPIAIKLWTSDVKREEQNLQNTDEVVLGGKPGMIAVQPDNNWHTISVDLASANGALVGVTIGAPKDYFGTSRLRSEFVQYEFRNFELSQDAGIKVARPGSFFSTPAWETEEALREVLNTGSRYEKRTVLANVDKLKTYKGLAPILLNLSGDIDAGIAHDATKAYFEVILNGQPTPDELASLSKFLKSPPNEASREVALSYVGKNLAFAAAGDVAACSVRSSWRVRMLALRALGELSRSNIREKEFCKQLLLTSTAQEMALMRKTAIEQLDPSLPKDSERLISLMVNDPQESVRLKCLKILAASSNPPKDKILGTLADDSPTLREQVPAMLGPTNPLLREVLQKMVVDQDPYVRVAALRGLAAQKNVQEGEIQNLFADKHPAVQIALLEGAKKGAWKIPADTLEKLKGSSIKAVAVLANEVK